MTALQVFLVAYLAGVVAGTGQLVQLLRTPRRAGAHRARGRMTRHAERVLAAATRASRAAYAAHQALVAERKFPDFAPDPAFVLPPPTSRAPNAYDHHIGAGRYAHLRIAELDATAERKLRLRGLGDAPVVDLQALRVRGSVPTVGEVDDEWYAEVMAG